MSAVNGNGNGNGRRPDYDAIVVGGGHNGLTTAAYLASAGLRVLVLERAHILGGACVTEELWPGRRVSRASYVVSMLQPKVVTDLELDDVRLPRDPARPRRSRRSPRTGPDRCCPTTTRSPTSRSRASRTRTPTRCAPSNAPLRRRRSSSSR